MEEMTKNEARVRIFGALEKQKEVSEIYIKLRPVSRIHYKKLSALAEEIVGTKGREVSGEFIVKDEHLNLVVKVSKIGLEPW